MQIGRSSLYFSERAISSIIMGFAISALDKATVYTEQPRRN